MEILHSKGNVLRKKSVRKRLKRFLAPNAPGLHPRESKQAFCSPGKPPDCTLTNRNELVARPDCARTAPTRVETTFLLARTAPTRIGMRSRSRPERIRTAPTRVETSFLLARTAPGLHPRESKQAFCSPGLHPCRRRQCKRSWEKWKSFIVKAMF